MGSVWPASQGRQGDAENKLAILTLAQVSLLAFTPPPPPLPPCPSSGCFKGQLTTRLCCSPQRGYIRIRSSNTEGPTCVIQTHIYELSFWSRSVWSGPSCHICGAQRKELFGAENMGNGKLKLIFFKQFCHRHILNGKSSVVIKGWTEATVRLCWWLKSDTFSHGGEKNPPSDGYWIVTPTSTPNSPTSRTSTSLWTRVQL